MDKVATYREILTRIMLERSQPQPREADVRISPVIDTHNDHYGVMMVGWEKQHRYQGLVIHLDIIDGKIWVQYDGTYPGVVDDLLEAGIPKEDIVLGFHPPEVRPYTDFAVG